MPETDRLVVLIGHHATLSPIEVAACADGLAEVYFLADSRDTTPGLFSVAEQLAPTMWADFSDPDACLDAVRHSNATTVTTFVDRLCPLAAWLAGKLRGEPDPAPLWGRKDEQRRVLREAGLSEVASARVDDGASLRAFVRSAGFPVVVKPANGFGSHDVWLLRREADVEAFLRRAGTSPEETFDYMFAEQLITGENWAAPWRADYHSVEVFRPGGARRISPFVTDRLPPAWPFRETGVALPSMIAPERQPLLTAAAEQALDALGCGTGVFHIEMKPKLPAPEIIEVNGRLGGFLARLVHYGTGQNLGRLALSCILGRDVDVTLRWDRCAMILLFQPPPNAVGITAAPTRRQISRMPGVIAADKVSPAGTALDWRNGTIRSVAWVWLVADSHRELHERLVNLAEFLSDTFTFVDDHGRAVRDSDWLERISRPEDKETS